MELLDVYDKDKNKLGKTVDRANKQLLPGEYLNPTAIWIKNGIRYLIQLQSKQKGGEYAVTSGYVPAGATSRDHVLVECKEELGLDLSPDNIEYLGYIYYPHDIMDIYLYEDENANLEELPITLQKEEVEDSMWLTKDEIEDLILKGEFRESSARQYFMFIKNL